MTDKVDTQIIKYIDDQFYLTRNLWIKAKERKGINVPTTNS